MDSQVNSGTIDEAEEKLFGESNSSGGPKIEIKYVTDPKNGDTKIDISEVRQVFVGMGKEELMKFANDPFWVRVRWFLFILFWLIWFGMLTGAIAIIFFAPKCAAPDSSKWYKESPIYYLTPDQFKDSNKDGIGDLLGVESQLNDLKLLGIEAILLDPIMKSAGETEDVVDFKTIDTKYGVFEDLDKLIKSAKEKGIHILMKMIPNYSSINHNWFNKSVAKEEPYSNYYVWTDAIFDKDGTRQPRNNWLSVNGGSAWSWNDVRKQYYLHQFNSTQPDLNFRNEAVVKYFEDVLSFWLDKGFSGLYLDKVEFLVEDSNFLDEGTSGIVGKIHDEYDFQSHKYTAHLQDSWDILSHKWSKVFTNHSAVFAVSGVPDLKEADLIWRPINIAQSVQPKELEDAIIKRLNKSSQAWEFSCVDCTERMKVGLQAVLMMLPGAVILPSSLKLEQGFGKTQSNSPNANILTEGSESIYNIFKRISHERHNQTIISGMTDLKLLNSSVLAFTRFGSGKPHYFVGFNIQETELEVNLHDFFKDIPETYLAKNLIAASDIYFNSDLLTSKLVFPGHSFVIFQFVPGVDK